MPKRKAGGAHRLIVASALLLAGFAASDAAASVSAYRIESPEVLLSGPYADGQLHDYMLENDLIAVLITAIGHSVHYAESGGNIIDAGSSVDRVDAVSEFYTYFDDDWPRQADYSSLMIIDDGAGGGPAVIRVSGVDSYNSALDVVTEYSLSSGAAWLSITTIVSNTGGSSNPSFELGDAFSWGDCRTFAPGHGFDLSGTSTEAWIAGTASAVSYGYHSPLGDIWGPHGAHWSDLNCVSYYLGPGDTIDFTRHFIVGGRDVASVATVIHEIDGMPVGTVQCTVTSGATGEPLASASIDAFDDLEQIYLQMETDSEGLAASTLPIGLWRLVASTWGHLPAETWISSVEGYTTQVDFILEVDGDIPAIGDTLTIIQRPLLNIPALVTEGDTLRIDCDADPATSGWAAELSRGSLQVPLPVSSAVYDADTSWWRITALIPAVPLYELYDLRVSAEGGIDDLSWNAVSVLPEFKDDYYFIHITDTHLPTTLYYTETGAEDDSSSVIDLREVIDDINIINPEFVLLTGDLVNEGELEDFLYGRYYTRSQRQLAEFQVPVYLSSGNHDLGGWVATPPPAGTARRDWWRFYGWSRLDDPPPGAPERTQNYSFDYGPVHYVGLEAYDNYDLWRSEIYGETSFISSQLLWLVDNLSAAAGSASQVLFYHFDFKHELDLAALGVEMALWGHIHHDAGSIYTQPYDLATNNVCHGERAYRLVRVSDGVPTPTATLWSGNSGENLRAEYEPANDGTHYIVSAQVANELNERYEDAELRFLMPNEPGSIEVSGGTLRQIDDSDSPAVYYIGVDIPPFSSQTVTVTLDPTGVGDDGPPPLLRLGQNFPNPFNPFTTLHYSLPLPQRVRLAIFDVAGREVAILVDGLRPAGEQAAEWHGLDGHGRPAPSGVYFVRLLVNGQTLSRKIVLTR